MNRQQRRRLKREKENVKTYSLTAAQVVDLNKESMERALDDKAKKATLEAFIYTFYIPLWTLRNMGWGKKRLTEFAQKMVEEWEYYEDNYFATQDIKDQLKEEVGIEISFKLNHDKRKSRIEVITQ